MEGIVITPETLNEVEALCQPGRDVSAVCEFAYTGGVGDLIRYIRHLEEQVAKRDACGAKIARTFGDCCRERDRRIAELEDDRQRAFKIGYQLTLDCQTAEEMTAALVERVRRAEGVQLESQRALTRAAAVRAEKAEAKYRDTQEMIRSAIEPHYVRRIAELDAALRGLLAVVQHCYPMHATPCECDESVGSVCETCADRRARAEATRALGAKP